MHSIKRAMNIWSSLPGNWDTLHLGELFASSNEYGIPLLEKCSRVPAQLVQWGSRPDLLASPANSAIHFFVDDYRFECIWKQPARYVDLIQHVGCALTPDFSLFRDMPLAMQIWNVYRNRWLGCYWQSYGIEVIPTISWSQPHEFCYAGVERGSIVAVSTVGLNDQTARYLFREGFEKMIDVIQPKTILCYGRMPRDICVDNVVVFPTRWNERKRDCMTLSLWNERANE